MDVSSTTGEGAGLCRSEGLILVGLFMSAPNDLKDMRLVLTGTYTVTTEPRAAPATHQDLTLRRVGGTFEDDGVLR